MYYKGMLFLCLVVGWMDKGLKGCWMDVGWVDVNKCVFDKVDNMLMFNDTLERRTSWNIWNGYVCPPGFHSSNSIFGLFWQEFFWTILPFCKVFCRHGSQISLSQLGRPFLQQQNHGDFFWYDDSLVFSLKPILTWEICQWNDAITL